MVAKKNYASSNKNKKDKQYLRLNQTIWKNLNIKKFKQQINIPN